MEAGARVRAPRYALHEEPSPFDDDEAPLLFPELRASG